VRVTRDERAARAAKLLAIRLEQLAAAAERATSMGEPLLVRRIQLACMSTQHAIDLQLLTEEQAEAIWQHAETRHPALAALAASVLEEASPGLPAEASFGDQVA
jgi:hypothetical protein